MGFLVSILLEYFCHLMFFQDLPADIGVCVFVLEQALSVRALQEMVSAQSQEAVSHSSF